MKKIPLIFLFDHDVHKMTTTPNPVAQWVFDGEGVATRKYDGTACAVITTCTPGTDGETTQLHRRHCVKPGKKTPEGFRMVQHDLTTGKSVGWVPVNANNPGDKYFVEAWHPKLKEGTYELIGPKVQGNPEKVSRHILVKHSEALQYQQPGLGRNYDYLKYWLSTRDIEGLVFHHPNGRMAKIRKKDFGLDRKPVDTRPQS